MHLVLLSGVSGSGKSVALKALEDAGFFCVDNLPAEMIPALVASRREDKVAISADARSPEKLGILPQLVEAERKRGHQVSVIFLDTNDESLVRRFAESRRPHPLSKEGLSIAEAIAEERRLLAGLAEMGNRIDTSALQPSQLRQWIHDLVVTDRKQLSLVLQSFGYKAGVPLDADFVFDVRCLPNPYYDPKLRPLTGADHEVVSFLERETEAGLLIEEVAHFLQRWLPKFVLDQRASLTIAIGCTGGRHRSVYIANQLAGRFGADYRVIVRHRDIQK